MSLDGRESLTGDDALPWAVVHRYLAGECTPNERVVIEAWGHRRGVDPLDLDAMRQALHQLTPMSEAPDPRAIWGQVRQRTVAPSSTRHERMPAWSSVAPAASHRIWPSVSAVMAAVCIVAIGWYAAATHLRQRTAHVYATSAAQQLTITLADGTRATLGPASRLEVAPSFNGATRAVALEGEVYFSVVHNADHPFTVHVRGTTIRDVGTVFDVRAYPTDSAVQVAVAEGAVAVGSIVGTARDLLHIDGSHVSIDHDVDLTALTSWRQGHLVFDATPLREVVRDLERTFDLKITIADSVLAGRQVTATFETESEKQVLDEVTRLVGAEYTRSKRQIVVRLRAVPLVGRDSLAPPFLPLKTATRINE